MKYFLTGATGFIGGKLASLLRERGHEVVALVRDPARAGGLAAAGVTLAKGDITDAGTLRGPMAGCDGVFHVAGWYKIGATKAEAAQGQRINVDGTRNVLEAMRDLQIPKGVYTSTLAIFSDTKGKIPDETYRYDGPHLSEYDRTKADAHFKVAEPMMKAGLPLVIVQPGVVYGPDDPSATGDTLRQFLQRKLPGVPSGSAYCWAHVDDIARAHLLAMEKGRPGEDYIICGEPKTLEAALKMASEITGIPAPRTLPSGLLKAVAGLAGVFSPAQGEYYRVLAGATYLGDNAKARHELAYNPRSLRDGLTETLEYERRKLGV